MRTIRSSVCPAIAAIGCVLGLITSTQAGPVVTGFDRFHAEKPDAAGGRLLIGELNCVACHKATGPSAVSIQTNPAPFLGDVGSRLKAPWVKSFIADPQKTKPGARMPGPPHGLPAGEVETISEAITHYLMSQVGKPIAIQAKTADGAKLFDSVGCAACHAPLAKGADVKDDKGVVPLPDLAAKYQNAASLAGFLLDPHKWRSGGRMPKLGLTNDEAMSIAAAFGLSGGVGVRVGVRNSDDAAIKAAGLDAELVQGISFALYEGNWNKLPDFSTLKSKETGVAKKFDPNKIKGEDNMAIRYTGYIDIPRDGVYTFSSHSDDGSRVTIGRDVVVNHDGIHGGTELSGSIELKKGKHAITVDYFEAQGGEELQISIEGPKVPRQEIPAGILYRAKNGKFVIGDDAKPAPSDAFAPKPELVEKGKAMFVAVGCASCHTMKAGDKPIAMPLEPKGLAALKNSKGKGCLSEKPTGFSQNFEFTKAQIDAIDAALQTIDTAVELTAAQSIDRTMTSMNCYACHVRGTKGGPQEGQKKSFTTNYADLADEGRLPPHLGDVGAKMQKGWLNQILTQGTKVRPYMMTRMPVFGAAVSHLTEDFEKADAVKDTFNYPAVDSKDAMKHGRQLAGTNGMSCIQCHLFAGQKSLGLPAMDLAYMPQRLKREWFQRYLLNPMELRPGTRMPQFWPQGKSVRKDILDGDTDKQIENLWQYLSKGNQAPLPHGISRNEILLADDTNAVIYRNFITGAGPRGIGVGYPEKVNIAFDANQFRLAVMWHGDFIDASKHWIDRGAGYQNPYGYDVINFPDAASFATLADSTTAWPMSKKINNVTKAEGFQFLGYTTDKLDRPTLMYSYAGAKVSDFFEGIAPKPGMKEPALKRTLTIEAAKAENLYYRAAVASKIEAQAEQLYKAGDLHIRLDTKEKPIIRTVGNQMELLVPVKPVDGKAVIVQTYLW